MTGDLQEQLDALRKEIEALRQENRSLSQKLDKATEDHRELLSAHNDFGQHYDAHLEHTATMFITLIDAINGQLSVTQSEAAFKPGTLIGVTRELERVLAKRRSSN